MTSRASTTASGRSTAIALLGSFLLLFPGESTARADGLAFVTFLGVTKGDDLVFLPIEGGDGPFVWNRRDPTATVLDVPKTERLLTLTPSAGPLVLATTAKDPQTDLVRLYTLEEGARLVPAGTVPVEGRPTGAASIIDDEGVAWVFVETYRADHAETTAYRRSGERWKRLATARTEIGVPRRSGRGEISIYGWAFEARPSRVTARIPSTVSTKPGSPIIVERFGDCPGAAPHPRQGRRAPVPRRGRDPRRLLRRGDIRGRRRIPSPRRPMHRARSIPPRAIRLRRLARGRERGEGVLSCRSRRAGGRRRTGRRPRGRDPPPRAPARRRRTEHLLGRFRPGRSDIDLQSSRSMTDSAAGAIAPW